MPYASNTDLVLEFKGLSVSGGPLASSTVDEWCTQTSYMIDSYVGMKYSTPVVEATSPKAFSLLKHLTVQLVKPRIDGFLSVKTGDARTSQGKGPTIEDGAKVAMKMLCDIRDGKQGLLDATLVSQADGVRSTLTDNVSTTIPEFTREDPAW